MKFVTRAGWGAKPPRYKLRHVESTQGVKVHYEGTAVPVLLALPGNHSLCDDRVRAIQASHLANTKEDYSDIAYNAMVCPHGYVFEGRGAHFETGANGNQTLNYAHYSVCGMVGDSGLVKPTDEMLHGIRDAIEWLRSSGGAGNEIKGHRDGYATDCPGEPLYAWVKKGAPRPSTGATTPPKPPAPQYQPFPGVDFFMSGTRPALGKTSGIFTNMGKALVAAGVATYKVGPGPKLGQADVDSYEAFQRKIGYKGADAKWPPGPSSWAKLKVKHV